MTFTLRVPGKYQSITDGNDIKASHAPSATDWKVMGQNINYLLGQGSQLIPFTSLTGSRWLFREEIQTTIPVFSRPQALDRYWVIGAQTTGGIGTLNLTIGAQATQVLSIDRQPSYILYREANITGSASTSIESISFSASCNISASFFSIGCFEAPRLLLESGSTEMGVDDGSFQVRQPIFDDANAAEAKSVKAIGTGLSGALNVARTAGILSWMGAPFKIANAVQTTSDSASASSFTLCSFSASVRIRPVFRRWNTGADKFHPVTASTADFAAWIRGNNALATASLVFKTGAGETTHAIRVGNSSGMFTGSFPILCDGSSSLASAVGPGWVPFGQESPDRLSVTFSGSGGGSSFLYSLHIGERQKGL